MVTSQTWFRTRRNGSGSISLPDMAPFAGIIFLVVCFYLMTSKLPVPEVGIVPLENLPVTQEAVCWRGTLDGTDGAVISLNKRNQLSFTLPGFDRKFQAAVIREVALEYGVHLTPAQQCALEALPFLVHDVRQLPDILSAVKPTADTTSPTVATLLGPGQAAECVAAARKLIAIAKLPAVRCYLKIESDVSMLQVRRLTDMLQEQGINRFSLLTQTN